MPTKKQPHKTTKPAPSKTSALSSFDKSKTKENLARAFAGECQDGARYQFIAQQCMEEGYPYLQTIFKTFAKNEMAHAKTFYQLVFEHTGKSTGNIKITGGYPFECGDLKTSILDSIQTEVEQSQNVYPGFAKTARQEGYADIAHKFELVASVEDTHHRILRHILDKMKSGKLYKSSSDENWKCNNCGYVCICKTCWTKCHSCDMPQGYAQFNIELK